MNLRIAFFLFLFLSHAAVGEVVPFYVGTMTSAAGSKGIFLGSLDTGTGKLGPLSIAAVASNPNFLALTLDRKFLFAALSSTVGSYKVQPDGTLVALNEKPSGGAGPCHVTVDETGHHVFVANYDGGNIAEFNVDADGILGDRTALEQFSGSGPNHDRQNKPYAHSVYIGPENTMVYSCDLGSDKVWLFKFDASSGVLAAANPPSAQISPGSGPRHLAFHPNGKFVYVAGEMGHDVTVFARDAGSGALKKIETVSTLPPELKTAKGITTAEIVCHPTGKWLYVSNRGVDTIAVFRIAEDGTLNLVQSASSVAKFPRSFAVDPTGKWLISAGQNDNRLAVLKIDQETGQLSETDQTAAVGTPVCVLFVPQKK